MLVTSYLFLAFFVVTLLLYYIVQKNMQWVVLLVASFIFYAYAGIAYVAIVGLTAGVVYGIANLMQKNLDEQERLIKDADRKAARKIKSSKKRERKKLLILSLCMIIGVLFYFKGSGFVIKNLNRLLDSDGHQMISSFELIAPLGISFYSFMMISYLMELYNGKTRAEKNFFKYLTYVLYFPHITQGPIAKYEITSKEMFRKHFFSFDMVMKGILLMVWGYIKKLVIADRIALFVVKIVHHSSSYNGPIFLLVGIAYSIQIYCDFSGCMDIITGCSECFGIRLLENFRRPYFSQTMPEFWRRWHISLGAFFREYVFYPVSTSSACLKINTFARNKLGNEAGRDLASCIPIMCVWFLTGIWHGASWNYIGWGMYHGLLICLSTIFTEPLSGMMRFMKINTEGLGFRIFRMLRTFFLCLIGRLIFIGSGAMESLRMIVSMLTEWKYKISFEDLELNGASWFVVGVTCLLLFVVSVVQERMQQNCVEGTIRDKIMTKNVYVRMCVLMAGIIFVLCFGVYGSGVGTTFIYDKF
ncbi:MAG: MBOAT family O-acyltransferase [Eubacteriales bacterium]|nr:MBOAT family O-acyltransferase [Eubacteriales bacterium]